MLKILLRGTKSLFLALPSGLKGILWQFYKLGLKVPSGRDKNNGIGHFAELGSSWPGEAKTWPKIALRYVLRDGRPWTRPSSNTVLFFRSRPSLNTVLLWLRPSPSTQFSAHPPTRSAMFWPRFGLSWPAGAEFGKMTYTIVFVSARRNF